MPTMTPVASQIQAPNPMQGINAYSGILGLQQQQQALQTGQYQQQSAQANASQDQQKNQELQAVSNLMQSVHSGEYRNSDGSFNRQKFADDVTAVAPVYGRDVATSALSQANEVVLNQSAKQKLTDESRSSLGDLVTSLATNPDTRRGDVVDGITQYIQDHKEDPNAIRIATGALALLPADDNSPQFRNTLTKFAGSLTGKPQSTPSTIETAGKIQPGSTSNTTGTFTPAGAPINKPPSATPGPGGSVLNRDPNSGALSVPPGSNEPPPPAGGAAQSKLPPMNRPGINAPAADQSNYSARVQQLGQEYQAVSTAANDPMNGVQSTRFRNQQILDLIPHADTGPGMRLLNTIASRLPGASGDAYQDLEHYLSQNSASLAKSMGVPGTNLGAETAAAASGNVERNPGALREITRTNDALNTAMDLFNRGYAKVTNNGSDMGRAASYKQAFGQNLDINALRWADAHRRRDQEEIADLTKKLGPDGIKAAQQKLRILKSLSDNGDLP